MPEKLSGSEPMTTRWQRVLVDSWTRRGPLSFLLRPLSFGTGLLVMLRRHLYRLGVCKTQRVGVPVIVVGSVFAGGSGKTPVVVEIVRHLRSHGLRPGVVSRGYGRISRACLQVHDDSRVAAVGDEPLLIRQLTAAPVFVATTRIAAARALLAVFPDTDVLLCDDGLQHLALQRDIEVCVFDERVAGNGLLLPAGPLREPWPRRCDLILAPHRLTGYDSHIVQRSLCDLATRRDGTSVALEQLARAVGEARSALWAVAGIARPDQFFNMLRARGLVLQGTIALPDHARVSPQDLLPAGANTLLCTQKDAEKVWPLRPEALAVGLRLQLEAGFWTALDRLLVERCGAKLSSDDGHPTA